MADNLPDDLRQIDPQQAWQAAPPEIWNWKWACHLYRRASFGTSSVILRQAVQEGLHATLDRLIGKSPQAMRWAQLMEDTGRAFASKGDEDSLRAWWHYFMLQSGDPVREKLTLFWHNHFATSIAKVGRADLMLGQNLMQRRQAFGQFGQLLRAISRDPAMLIWLDSNQNVKSQPNENYGREMLELFSLGVGNYTEADVRETARAFTGWNSDSHGDQFEFHPEQHDSGPKTVLGQKGNWDGDDLIRIVLEQPACALFLVRKLYRFYVSETDPPPTLLQPLAEQFHKSKYEVAPLLRTILSSRLFFSQHAYRQRIKSPVELVLGMVLANLPGPVPPGAFVDALDAMGQALFAPPNVRGWTGGRNWLNHATILARHNFADSVAMGKLPIADGVPVKSVVVARKVAGELGVPAAIEIPVEPAPAFDCVTYLRNEKPLSPTEIVERLSENLLDGEIAPAAKARLVAFVAEGKPQDKALDNRIRETVHAIMCMPEYQLA
ncbi:MAG TPA: DUF1800 domain-containing protein [Gemmataceae bacterium]|nr:DUF1800 domain-containing protein [Gemmataceae bacterium]